jgi:HlyD family type I secretion membrane fusion protein
VSAPTRIVAGKWDGWHAPAFLASALRHLMPGILAMLRRATGMPRSTRYIDFLPEAQALTEREPAPLARALGLALCLLFAATLTWAAISEVEQVVSAQAVVRPVGRVKIVNHPEGGRVATISVREGDRVRAGETLLVLDDESVREEVARRRAGWQAAAAEAARLEAEASGRTPRFPPELIRDRPDLVDAQTTLFRSRQDSLDTRRATADQVIQQRKNEAGALAARIEQLSASLSILEEQERAIASLAGKGYFPKLRHLSVKRQLSELSGQIAETRKSAAAAVAGLGEARNRRVTIDEEWRSQVLDRLATAVRDAERSHSALMQERTRLRNRTLRAPGDGVVQGLAVTAAGQSVAPNETLMQVVPDDDHLVIEARVANDDIGHVRPGQRATIKVRAYDFVRYGRLDGEVERVAADAVEDRRTGALAFPVTIRVEHAWLGEGASRRRLAPGMQVDVDLVIGERSVLSYLTDRMIRTKESAFRER